MSVSFGLAIKNFVGPTETPGHRRDRGLRGARRALGFESLWAWDHVILGVEPAFPIIDALSMLAAIATRTTQIKLGTGVLVLPLRNPTVAAKAIGSIDVISQGPLHPGRGGGLVRPRVRRRRRALQAARPIIERNLEILTRLLTEDRVTLKARRVQPARGRACCPGRCSSRARRSSSAATWTPCSGGSPARATAG